MYEKKLDEDIRCPLEYGLSIFSGKWKSRILYLLAVHGKVRYSAIRRDIGNITDAVLASTLKEMIADGIIYREQYNEIPPRVEYSLTEKGRSALPMLFGICQWAAQYIKIDEDRLFPQCDECEHDCNMNNFHKYVDQQSG
jgi:Predicted transcriptional regulators